MFPIARFLITLLRGVSIVHCLDMCLSFRCFLAFFEVVMEYKSEVKLKDYYTADSIVLPGSKEADDFHTPTRPVIAFINSKSGGQFGGELLKTYHSLLNGNRVFYLGEKAPDVVLHRLYANIEILNKMGDKLAIEIDKRLRIIVVGGDSTASWLLGVISDLKLPRPPPVATVPLRTGNNLPFSFGWLTYNHEKENSKGRPM